MNTEALMVVFSWIGIAIVAGCVVTIICYAFDRLRDVVRACRWNYKYKHRFDKPPVAKCYCKDCIYHTTKDSNGMGPCEWPGVDRWMPDSGFCYNAEPRKKDQVG